jgi:hypothetical protein
MCPTRCGYGVGKTDREDTLTVLALSFVTPLLANENAGCHDIIGPEGGKHAALAQVIQWPPVSIIVRSRGLRFSAPFICLNGHHRLSKFALAG